MLAFDWCLLAVIIIPILSLSTAGSLGVSHDTFDTFPLHCCFTHKLYAENIYVELGIKSIDFAVFFIVLFTIFYYVLFLTMNSFIEIYIILDI